MHVDGQPTRGRFGINEERDPLIMGYGGNFLNRFNGPDLVIDQMNGDQNSFVRHRLAHTHRIDQTPCINGHARTGESLLVKKCDRVQDRRMLNAADYHVVAVALLSPGTFP